MSQTFTSESVSAAHPDKICDQISDAIVDAAIRIHPHSRVAVETLVTKNNVILAGEVTCPKKIPYEKIARTTIKCLGYTNSLYGFTNNSPISIYIHEQSEDIAKGVDNDGAGDQGMMFGFASDETPEYMPMPITFAHRVMERVDLMRLSKKIPYLRPDGKAQITCRYEKGKPIGIETLVIAVPHDPDVSVSDVTSDLQQLIIFPLCETYHIHKPSLTIINGTGKWEIGGPASDTGVTGRKIIVDTYGGYARHGGGCFSGKDPTKVDRSGAYACRYIARRIIEEGLAKRAEVRVAYVIGKKAPVDMGIECFGTERESISLIQRFAWKQLSLSVTDIIKDLQLLQPIYEKTAAYGHFGRDGFPWEKGIK